MSISSDRILQSISKRPNTREENNDGGDFFTKKISIVEIILTGQLDVLLEALEEEPERVNEFCPTFGVTPIMAASGRNMIRASTILLSIDGIDLSLRDFAGRSVYDHAAPFPQMLSALLEYSGYSLNWMEPSP
jgi:hypothetical protein